MKIYKKQSLAETFSVYFDRRMIKILLLGAISGFPWVIIGSSLSLWLKEDGLSRTTIGWAGLIFAVSFPSQQKYLLPLLGPFHFLSRQVRFLLLPGFLA
mgnify:CR=1 FL=1